MPSIASNFLEVLTFVAPGLVFSFALRYQTAFLKSLFDNLSSQNGTAILAALLVNAVALGLIVSGVASLIVPWVARFSYIGTPPVPLTYKKINFANVYKQPRKTIEVLQQQTRIYQAYGSMAVSLFLSWAAICYAYFLDSVHIDHFWFKFCLLLSSAIFLLCAAVRYFYFLCLFNYQLDTQRLAVPAGG